MTLTLEPVLKSEFDALFSRIKEGIFPYVNTVFGWDDAFQRQRLNNEYQPDWFYWVEMDKNRVGVFCCKFYDASYHVHWLIVFPEWQQQKIGKSIMGYVASMARKEACTHVTLSSFRRFGFIKGWAMK